MIKSNSVSKSTFQTRFWVDSIWSISFGEHILANARHHLSSESGSVEQDRKISSQVLAQLRVPHDDSAASGLIPGQRSNKQNARPTNVYGAAGRVATSTALATLQPALTDGKVTAGHKPVSIWTRLPSHVADAQGDRRRGAGKLGAHAAAPKVLSVNFLRKYIQYCRTKVNPELSDEAAEEIAEFYAKIREVRWDTHFKIPILDAHS